jgi:glutamate/tyrosine decarboxylase-like PLP-dependent enzyme
MDSPFEGPLKVAADCSLKYLAGLDQYPVAATLNLEQLRRNLSAPLPDQGVDAEQVVCDLARDVQGGLLGSAGGRFFGWVIGGAVPAALAADWLTSAWDQNAALYACSPAAAVVEEVAGAWLKELLSLPAHASFALVTGCGLAHFTCLAAARNHLLQRRGWDVERKGLAGSPPIRILTSTEKHASFERAVRFAGLGLDSIELLPVCADGRMDPGALRQALAAREDAPTIVLLQAGDINIGAFDDFATLIPIAKAAGAWVHVDGAFGLWAAASPRFKHLTGGVELADSWATDGHKWLNVPYDSGFAFVAHPASHKAAMSHRAPYITHDDDARDEMDWNPEWSRRARGFAAYAAIRQLGRQGIAEMVERCCDRAREIVRGIGELPRAEMLWEPTLNQGLVRFLDATPAGDHDRRTTEVIARILQDGGAFFGSTTWREKKAMRVSVCNWQTSESHVKAAVETCARALAIA